MSKLRRLFKMMLIRWRSYPIERALTDSQPIITRILSILLNTRSKEKWHWEEWTIMTERVISKLFRYWNVDMKSRTCFNWNDNWCFYSRVISVWQGPEFSRSENKGTFSLCRPLIIFNRLYSANVKIQGRNRKFLSNVRTCQPWSCPPISLISENFLNFAWTLGTYGTSFSTSILCG